MWKDQSLEGFHIPLDITDTVDIEIHLKMKVGDNDYAHGLPRSLPHSLDVKK